MRKLTYSLALLCMMVGVNAADVVFYNGSTNEGSWPSWGQFTAPNTLTMNASSAIQTNTAFHLEGKEASLYLKWLSAPHGTTWPWWDISIAANAAWSAQDISACTTLQMWVYSTSQLAANALPQLYLKNGDAYTNNVKPGDFATSGIAANVWTKIEIPLSSFVFSPASTSVDRIVFHKDIDDNVEHTLYIGEIAFTSSVTALKNNELTNALPFYSDGLLHIKGSRGRIQIHDMAGKLLETKEITNETVSVNLHKGVYIINKDNGSFKLVVK